MVYYDMSDTVCVYNMAKKLKCGVKMWPQVICAVDYYGLELHLIAGVMMTGAKTTSRVSQSTGS